VLRGKSSSTLVTEQLRGRRLLRPLRSSTLVTMATTYRRQLGTRLIKFVVPRPDQARVGSVMPPHPHGARAQNRTATLHPGRRARGGRESLVSRRLRAANWVLNTRAAGGVTLSRGARSETYKVKEAGSEVAIPVLRKYIAETRVTRPTSTRNQTHPTRPLRQNCRNTRLSVDPDAVSCRHHLPTREVCIPEATHGMVRSGSIAAIGGRAALSG